MLKLYLIIGIMCLVSAAAFYVNNLQKNLEAAISSNAKLSQVAKNNESTIIALEKNLIVYKELSNKLNQDLQEANNDKTVLLQKLQKHDLTRIALEKPKLLEDRVNAATAKLFNDIELITSD
jgi:hypothetical protein